MFMCSASAGTNVLAATARDVAKDETLAALLSELPIRASLQGLTIKNKTTKSYNKINKNSK
jgi:hypothetical protein